MNLSDNLDNTPPNHLLLKIATSKNRNIINIAPLIPYLSISDVISFTPIYIYVFLLYIFNMVFGKEEMSYKLDKTH